jgi:hypothetical protein
MDEFDLIGDALCSVRMIKAVYGTGHDGATRIDEVAEILRLRAKQLSGNDEAGRSKSTTLAIAVADAIRKTYGTPV